MIKRIYLVRHCEAEGQSIQSPLTLDGMKQSEHLCDFFSNISIQKIISSPFLRAVQTIKPLSKKLDIEIEVDKRLSERTLSSKNLPDWFDKLKATFEDMDLAFEGGESSSDATQRIVNVLDSVLNENTNNIIIVTHGNILSLLIKKFDEHFGFEQWRNLSNPDVYLLTVSKEHHQIERLWEGN